MNTLQIAIVEACCEAFGVTATNVLKAVTAPRCPPDNFRLAKWAAMIVIRERYSHSNKSLASVFELDHKTVQSHMTKASKRLKTDNQFAATVASLIHEFMPWVPKEES
jgi:chromosomal replication initiation ATPase DnaA